MKTMTSFPSTVPAFVRQGLPLKPRGWLELSTQPRLASNLWRSSRFSLLNEQPDPGYNSTCFLIKTLLLMCTWDVGGGSPHSRSEDSSEELALSFSLRVDEAQTRVVRRGWQVSWPAESSHWPNSRCQWYHISKRIPNILLNQGFQIF